MCSDQVTHHLQLSRRARSCFYFFFNDTATTEIYTLSLHDALPICRPPQGQSHPRPLFLEVGRLGVEHVLEAVADEGRSEEHTSELQSLRHLVCRLLLEKKKPKSKQNIIMA